MAAEFELAKDFYRLRSVAEGFFGGLANRYLSRTRCKLLSTAVSTLLLMVVAHDLRVLARVQAMNGQEIFILLWIYLTNPYSQKKDKSGAEAQPFRNQEVPICIGNQA
jgi:hypothetical protein